MEIIKVCIVTWLILLEIFENISGALRANVSLKVHLEAMSRFRKATPTTSHCLASLKPHFAQWANSHVDTRVDDYPKKVLKKSSFALNPSSGLE